MNTYPKLMLKKVRSLYIPKPTKCFATWLPLGKIVIPVSLEGTHKGSKAGERSEEPSRGVSVTC